MAQRILERGEIELLAQRDIPRILLNPAGPDFAARAARLRTLAQDSPMAGYLALIATLCDAQQVVFDQVDDASRARLREHAQAAAVAARGTGMPPLNASGWSRDPQWRDLLKALCEQCDAQPEVPEGVHAMLQRLREAPTEWLEAQADALLEVTGAPAVDAASAPFVMAALQVHWALLAQAFEAAKLTPMPDVPGLCPVCGTSPVASLVYAQPPQAGYRYLACGLCGCQWHHVRVLCSRCGAGGKDIAYQAATPEAADAAVAREEAVRAETCEQCHGYRKILYQEKDAAVEPLADDLATLPLDLLLGELGYARASQNPFLWQPAGD